MNCIYDKYGIIIELLNFFAKCGRLEIIDRFAGSMGKDAIEVLKDAIEIVRRLTQRATKFRSRDGREYIACEWGDIKDPEEEKLIVRRGAKISEDGREWFVECPKLPNVETIARFECELYSPRAKEVIDLVVSAALGW